MRRFSLCWLIALVLLTGCKKDVSGSYLADDNVAVCWLQLVRTPDDHVTGQMVAAILNPDGKIVHSSVSLTGAVNGENITLTGGGFLGMTITALSGTLDGNNLTLTGVQSIPVTLKRATLADYQAKLGEQTAHSQKIISALATAAAQQRTIQAQKNFASEVDQMVARMQRFDSDADVHLGRFPNAENIYEAITAKVNVYVTRERQLAGNPNLIAARSQLYAAANQTSVATDQMHNQGQALQSSLEANITPLYYDTATIERNCHPTEPDRNLTPPQVEARQAVCNRFLGVVPTFRQKYAAVTAGLNHLEEIYRREKNAQARLMAEAEKLE